MGNAVDAGRDEQEFTHLVVLCCHAVYHGQVNADPRNEDNWALKPFQRGTDTKAGEHTTFLRHALAAVDLQNDHTIVAFSGGPTDAAYPHLSEAQSYVNALHASSSSSVGADNVLLEEVATDSYQNVLFSLLAFRRKTGYYPHQLTIVTHAFKSARFLQLHAKALRWPSDRVRVLGINPPFTLPELESTVDGEKRNGFGPWETDLYGTGPVLAGKRKARGWDEQKNHALESDLEPVVQRLIEYDGGAEVFSEVLPWE